MAPKRLAAKYRIWLKFDVCTHIPTLEPRGAKAADGAASLLPLLLKSCRFISRSLEEIHRGERLPVASRTIA